MLEELLSPQESWPLSVGKGHHAPRGPDQQLDKLRLHISAPGLPIGLPSWAWTLFLSDP